MKRWYDNTARGSHVTADVYLRRLGGFCQNRDTTPQELAGMSDEDLHNTLLDYVTWAEDEGHAGSYIHSTIKAARSWLAHNHREIRARIKIRGASDTPSLRDERVPTPHELRKILLSGDKKARTACVLIAHSGLRPEVLGNYRGTDGLRLADLPEARVGQGTIQFEAIPTMIVVRRELSKAGHQYLTRQTLFPGRCACESHRTGDNNDPDRGNVRRSIGHA